MKETDPSLGHCPAPSGEEKGQREEQGEKGLDPPPTPTSQTPDNESSESVVCVPVLKLPDNLEGLLRPDSFPPLRHRWNTNEEIAGILISFCRHADWLSKEVKIRPKSGSMLLYSRKKVRYRRDGYCWKKRKDGKTTREDHMKLKVQGTECIYGCYVHSAILPTFHRRCYWLLQNPDIVLVHYLNVPYPDEQKLIITANVSLWGERKEWTKDELISQLRPMFFSEEEPDLNNELEISTAETVESIVHQLMEKQRMARQTTTLDTSTPQPPLPLPTPTPREKKGPPLNQTLPPPAQAPPPQQQQPIQQNLALETFAQQDESSRGGRAGRGGLLEQRPFLLNLAHFQSTGGLIILNGKPGTTATLASAVSKSTQQHHIQHAATFPTLHNSNLVSSRVVAARSPVPEEGRSLSLGGENGNVRQMVASPALFTQEPVPVVQQEPTPPPFFQQETLDMSHEDIQQTLSANMLETGTDLEPMSPSADDVFVNLDAFDILADLSEDFDHHAQTQTSDKTTIVDINPEWAYTEGGTKILIVGEFPNPNWDYTVQFGDLAVPAAYLQTGVLKCFCPPHSAGLVPIRVQSSEKHICSNSMVFEYKADLRLSLVPVPPSETSLKLCLIQRVDSLEKCFRNFKSDICGGKSLEDSVVQICASMMREEVMGSDPAPDPAERGMTLLHLTAALGFTRLLLTLLEWRRTNPVTAKHLHINPLKTDDFGLIPIMWCARRGHLECGVILAQWSPESVRRRDLSGQNPVQIAVSAGFTRFAAELEKVQMAPRLLTARPPQFGISSRETSIFTPRSLSRFHTPSPASHDFGLKDCFFGQTDGSVELSLPSEEESRVLTLAEQIIAAMPDRIKKESCEEMSPCESIDSCSMMSSEPSDQTEFSLDFSERNYRYYEGGTPCSSLSPSSTSCLESPCSSFTVDSPQPTTADFCEFLQASAFEQTFSALTLSDSEQRELYEAAKVIQKAYRSYKGRKKMEEEQKEKGAAVIIQNYYRRYKEYAYLRQVTQAALVIQNQYRHYCENKRFKQSQETFRLPTDPQPFNTSQTLPRGSSQRRQHQAAKKIQQFMRQSKNKLQNERVEKEKRRDP